MKDKVFIDGYLVPEATEQDVWRAFGEGRRVVLVDGANVPVELTTELLARLSDQ